jgi:DNA-binding NtrC family response regulator
MSAPGGAIEPEHLSADLTAPARSTAGNIEAGLVPFTDLAGNLASAVETVERHLIASTLDRTRGNISESARVLGLTRRGLYLKMRRLGLEGAIADI